YLLRVGLTQARSASEGISQLPSLALFEVALDVCSGVIMGQVRDSFASARSPGRVTVYHHCPPPWKESPRDLRRRLAPHQVLLAPRPPERRQRGAPPPPGGCLRLPPRPPVRLPGRRRHPLSGPSPRPADALPGSLPLVPGLVRPGRRRRPAAAPG